MAERDAQGKAGGGLPFFVNGSTVVPGAVDHTDGPGRSAAPIGARPTIGDAIGFLANAALVIAVVVSFVARAQIEFDKQDKPTAGYSWYSDEPTDAPRPHSLEELEKLLDDLDRAPAPSSPDR